MLPDPTVPTSLLAVLELVGGSFTTPTFRTFVALVTGLTAQTGRGTVTGMLSGAGLTRLWSHDRAHAFFSRARWNPDILGISLSHLIVRRLLPEGAVLTVAVDDTLFKRRGKKVFGAAWQRDGAATGPKPVGRGTCFVVVGLVVELPMLERPVCLPVMARPWRPKQKKSKVDIAASMLRFLAACHHGRRLHVVADAAYHGKSLRDLPRNVTFTTRLSATAVLYDLAPPRTGKRGRPALKGTRLHGAGRSR
ncbi:transposase [Streptomyces sp. NPDC051020]|uniref:transposase n=1 Tax=Streptomyces sp. NPDC051020 TaxID=3155409 RepID=UPI00343CB61A